MKTKNNILLLLTLSIIAWPPQYSEAAMKYTAVIRLIDTISVRAPVVYLGEIANIESKNKELQDKLTNIVVGTAPSVGNSSTISSYKIKSILKDAGFSGFKLYGFQSAIRTEVRSISNEEIKGLVEEWVRENSKQSNDIEFKFTSVPSLWNIPKGEDVEIRIENRSRKKLTGPLSLSLRAFSKDRVFSTSRVRLNISLFKKALVLLRPLKNGDALKESDIEWRRSDVTRSKGMEVIHIESVLGKVVKKDLKVGTLISIKDFELPVSIERGTLNRIIIVNGPVRMNITGAEALQNGKKGDIIFFTNPMNAKKRLNARVVDTGIAMIEIK